MSIFKTQYRVVPDKYLGFEAQKKPWWSPFWFQIGFCNTFATLDGAKKLCLLDKGNVLWRDNDA